MADMATNKGIQGYCTAEYVPAFRRGARWLSEGGRDGFQKGGADGFRREARWLLERRRDGFQKGGADAFRRKEAARGALDA